MFSIFSLFYGRRRPAELLGGFVPELDEELDVFGTSSSSAVCTRPHITRTAELKNRVQCNLIAEWREGAQELPTSPFFVVLVLEKLVRMMIAEG